MKTYLRCGYVLLATILLASCGGGGSTVTETPTSGNIKIGVDGSYQLMADYQIDLLGAI